jgi:hypothetical protein
MTPEDVRVVFEKSLRGERKKRAATRNDTRKERAVRLSAHASGCTGSSHGATASRDRRRQASVVGLNDAGSSSLRKSYPTSEYELVQQSQPLPAQLTPVTLPLARG